MSKDSGFDFSSLAEARDFGEEVDFQEVYGAIQAAEDSATLNQAYMIARRLVFDLGEKQKISGAKPLGAGMLGEIAQRAGALLRKRKNELHISQYDDDDEIYELEAMINNVTFDRGNLYTN